MAESQNQEKLLGVLNEIIEMELSGVTRYLHYALMVRGPGRLPIVQFFKEQAIESFNHAMTVGEKITGLGGHPSLKSAPVKETNKHTIHELLKESLEAEIHGIDLYKKALPLVGDNLALEELVREFIRTEQEHIEEVQKMFLE